MVQTAWMWPIRRCSELFPVPEAEAHALRDLERTLDAARWQQQRDREIEVWHPDTRTGVRWMSWSGTSMASDVSGWLNTLCRRLGSVSS